MTEAYDYSTDIAPVGDNLLMQIAATALTCQAQEAAVVAAEAALDTEKRKLKELKERTLPELMTAAGQKEITTADNLVVKLEEVVRASIPADRQQEGFSWLRDNGHGGVIKNQLTVEIPKGGDELARLIVEHVHSLSPSALVALKESVHAGTLASLVRELLAGGADIPMEVLGAHVMTAAKVTVKKKKA